MGSSSMPLSYEVWNRLASSEYGACEGGLACLDVRPPPRPGRLTLNT